MRVLPCLQGYLHHHCMALAHAYRPHKLLAVQCLAGSFARLSRRIAYPNLLQKLTSGLRPAGLLGHLNQSLQGDVTYRATEIQALTNPFYAPAPALAYAPAPAAWLPLPAQPQVQVQIQLQGSGLVPLTPQLAQGVSSGLSTLFRAFNINFTVTGMVPSDIGRDVWPAMQLQLAAAAPAGSLPEPGSGMAAAAAPSAEPGAPAGLPRPQARLLPEVGTSMAAATDPSSTVKPPAGLPRRSAGLLPEVGVAAAAPSLSDLALPAELLSPVSTLTLPPSDGAQHRRSSTGPSDVPQASGAHIAATPGPTGSKSHLKALQAAPEPAPQPGQPASAMGLSGALQAAAEPQTGHPAAATTQPTAAGATPEPAAPLPTSEVQQPQISPLKTAPAGFVAQALHAAQQAAASLPDNSSPPAHPETLSETEDVPSQLHTAHPASPIAANGPTAPKEQGVAPAQPDDPARGQEGCTPTLSGPDPALAAPWTAANLLLPPALLEHQPVWKAADVPWLSALLQPGPVRRRLQAAPQPEQAVHGTAGRTPSGSGFHSVTQAKQQAHLAGHHLHSKHVQDDQQADAVSLSMYQSHVSGHRNPFQKQTHHQAHPRFDHNSTSSGSLLGRDALAHHKHRPKLRSPSPDGPSQSPAPGATSAHLNFTELLTRLGLLASRLPVALPGGAQAWTAPPDFTYLPFPKAHPTSQSPISDLNHHSPPQPSQTDASPPILGQPHTARAEPVIQLRQALPQPSLLRPCRALRVLLQQADPSLTPYINVTATLSPSGLLLNKEQPAPVFASMAVDSTRLNMAFVGSLLHADGLPVENAVFLSSNLPGDSSGEGFMPLWSVIPRCCMPAAS